MRCKVVIPAAGEGRRLKPHTLTKPKVLIEVAGKPIIGHIMDRVLAARPVEVCVVVSPGSRDLQKYLVSSYSCRFRFVVQHEPRGLGDAVYHCRAHFDGEPILIVLGDTIVDADIRQFTSRGSALAVKPVADPKRFGVVEVAGGRVVKLVEKPVRPKSNLAVVGLYFFTDSRRLFDSLSELKARRMTTRGEYQLTDAIQLLVNAGERVVPRRTATWLDCGTPDALLSTNHYLLSKGTRAQAMESAVIVPPVYIDPLADISRSVIGPDVSVGAGARVRDSVVRDSIIHAGAAVEGALLEHSIIGEKSVVTGTARRLNLGSYSELHTG